MILKDLIPFAIVATMMILWVKIETRVSRGLDQFTGSGFLSELIILAASFLGFIIASSIGTLTGGWW